jgi:uracil-DNA glycosylase
MSGQGRSPLQTDETGTRALESLLGFWAEAGVDTAFADEPVDRIAERPRPLPSPARATAEPRPAADPDVSGAIAEARRLAGEAQDLAALAAAIAAFDGCGLKFEGARQAVFSRGIADAPVMVIGEAPGADEDMQGQPFVGRAGKLLDKMLIAAGLMDRVFITNTVFWRPSGNRNPTAQEQLVCAPFLERAIALVAPKLLLLAGGASAKAMLQRPEGILALRGRWFDWTSADGALALPVLPTLHPAFLLRQPAAKKRAWADLLMLSERLDRPERPAD